MSRPNSKIIENPEFVKRFTEICGSSRPHEVSQLLDIPYQTVRNYLNGRFPETKFLLLIAEKTHCSIHWLLTGEGKKFVEDRRKHDTQILTDEMKTFIREICVEVVNELSAVNKSNNQPKTVILTPDKIRSEKILPK